MYIKPAAKEMIIGIGRLTIEKSFFTTDPRINPSIIEKTIKKPAAFSNFQPRPNPIKIRGNTDNQILSHKE